MPTPKPRKCKNKGCEATFTPRNSLHSVCSPMCALAMLRERQDKRERKANREAKQRLKTKSQWTKEAQAAFNLYIRLRDHNEPCICCGEWGADEWYKTGGQWDAGHFLSRGAYPELRFNEDNCHKQLKSCNAGSSKYARKGRTVAKGYREGLIKKIGLKRVEKLEGPHEAANYTIDELKAIKKKYQALCRQLQQAA